MGAYAETTNRQRLVEVLTCDLMEVVIRAAQRRLLIGIQSTNEDSARELRTIPTPPIPAAALSGVPDVRRK